MHLLATRDDFRTLTVSALFLSDNVLAHVILVLAVLIKHVLRWRFIHNHVLICIDRIFVIICKLSSIDISIILEFTVRIRIITIMQKVLTLLIPI